MMRWWLCAVLVMAMPTIVLAQSAPNLNDGDRPSGATWRSFFAAKADALNGVLTAPTITGGTINAAGISVGGTPVSTTTFLYMPLSAGAFAGTCAAQPSGTVARIAGVITVCP